MNARSPILLVEGDLGRRDILLTRILDRTVRVFRPEVLALDINTPCWEWKGPTSGESGRGCGYPRMSLDGQTVAVHRVVYTHFFGYIHSRRHVDHKCRNRLCVNPNHLEATTHRENCKRRDRAKSTSALDCS